MKALSSAISLCACCLKGWAHLPDDVLEPVLTRVSAADCWSSRQTCRHWARTARKIARFAVCIDVTEVNLQGKIRALSKLMSQQPVPNVQVVFSLKESLYPQDAVKLLQTLSSKVCHPSCSLCPFHFLEGIATPLPDHRSVHRWTPRQRSHSNLASYLQTPCALAK